jgi:hypothetical protein
MALVGGFYGKAKKIKEETDEERQGRFCSKKNRVR